MTNQRKWLEAGLTVLALAAGCSAEETTVASPKHNKTVDYHGAQVFSVKHVDKDKFDTFIQYVMEKEGVEEWIRNSSFAQIYVAKDLVDDVIKRLDDEGFDYTLVIENLQRAIESENPGPEDDEIVLQEKRGHRMSWTSYHRIADIYGYLDYLKQTYPNDVTVGSIGNSVEGRPIRYVKISSGDPDAKAFWIDGGIHAREWITPAAVSYLIHELVENQEAHSDWTQGIDFYIVPSLNPDGYEYTHTRDRLWRKNRSKGFLCQGVDLNRNWGYMWGGKGSSKQQCQDIYSGKAAFSEPETTAVRNFILKNVQNPMGFVTFHSYGQYILYPYGYDNNQLTDDSDDLEQVGRKMAHAMREVEGSRYTVGNSANALYPAAGGSDDWAKGVAHFKYTYTVELRDTGRHGFLLPCQYILATAKEALAAVKVIATEIQSCDDH